MLVLLSVCGFCRFYFAFVNARGSFTHILLVFFFGWVVSLFNLFFFTHFVHSNSVLFCCVEFSQLKFTVAQLKFTVMSAFFACFRFATIYIGALLLVLPSFSFFIFFGHFKLFSLFCGLITFAVPDYFACFACFSCFSLYTFILCRMCMCEGYLGTPHTPPIPLYDLWRSCVDLDILFNQFPPHTLAKIMPCGPICVSVCLVLCLLGANTSPCTHPNPFPPS